MVTTIANIRSMRNVGILADRTASSENLNFRRYNLIYGFNGSGKSTLSRVFASFQAAARDEHLPTDSTFEIELSDKTRLSCPDQMTGLENRIVVFNGDFVERNLQWSTARANPIFYIGAEQATLAAQLAQTESQIDALEGRRQIASIQKSHAEKSLQTFKRDLARTVADRLRLRNRKYEAPQLVHDFENVPFDSSSQLTEEQLEAFSVTSRQDAPMPKVTMPSARLEELPSFIEVTRELCQQRPSTIVLEGLDRHPAMLLWLKTGFEYHSGHALSNCLFCNSTITQERMQHLANALDDKLNQFIADINKTAQRFVVHLTEVRNLQTALPAEEQLSAGLRSSYRSARHAVQETARYAEAILEASAVLLEEKVRQPSLLIDVSSFPSTSDVEAAIQKLQAAIYSADLLLEDHNKQVEEFIQHQEMVQLFIKKHFLSQKAAEYSRFKEDAEKTAAALKTAEEAHANMKEFIAETRQKIQKHGPAATVINKLIQSYLGHNELTISSIDEGYEIHRFGRLIEGLPSEGEKTAIALCYFLSLLQSNGRKLKDLIVVVDDPISSLDSKALNFACSLVKSSLAGAAQFFVLTHNQNCMNEFRKAWKTKARADGGNILTATLLFIDVKSPVGRTMRSSSIVELPKLLREYDFEYHYLMSHVLTFSEIGDNSDYAYMMPNVLRRVLDVFLAFRCPGNHSIQDKIAQLCKVHAALDKDRLAALERLTQVESHSDSLDDLISFSTMTLEETKEATSTLLDMMAHVDKSHLEGIRHLCRP